MPGSDLVERVRAAMPPGRAVREVSMFGGRSFMLDGRMLVAARRGGDLLVRIDPARQPELLDVAGARPAVMGADRPMGPGWIAVAPDALADDVQLADWLQVALDFHAAQSAP